MKMLHLKQPKYAKANFFVRYCDTLLLSVLTYPVVETCFIDVLTGHIRKLTPKHAFRTFSKQSILVSNTQDIDK